MAKVQKFPALFSVFCLYVVQFDKNKWREIQKGFITVFLHFLCFKGDVKAFIYDALVFLSVIVILEIENVGDPLEWSLIDSYS